MRNRSRRNSALNQSGSSERQPDRTTAGAEGCLSSAALEGLRSECSTVWFDRGTFERAESLYYFTMLQQQNGTTAPASSSASSRKQETCRHGGQEACHHVVQAVWVNKPNFDQAESKFVGHFPNQPTTLQLQPNSQTSCDEGYQSQTPTPPTPASRPINGLPCLPPPPMGVWLQKPLFDRAEASFYQNLYSRNSPPRNPETSGDKSSSKRRNNGVAAQKKPVVCDRRDSPDVSTNQGAALCYFLHADSERVWLDRGRYVEAETRFYKGAAARSVKTSINHSSRKQKYDSILQKDCTHILVQPSCLSKPALLLFLERPTNHLLLCSLEDSKSYGFGTTCRSEFTVFGELSLLLSGNPSLTHCVYIQPSLLLLSTIFIAYFSSFLYSLISFDTFILVAFCRCVGLKDSFV